MVIKVKVSDVAKDFGKSNKEIIELLDKYCGGPAKKASTVLEENELNILFDNLICRHSEQTCKIADGNFLGNLNFNLLLLSLLGNSGKALLLGFPFGMSPDALRLFLSVLL